MSRCSHLKVAKMALAGKAKELKFTCELNKAACFLKLQMFAEAKVACRLVLEEPSCRNVKALFRRAQAGSEGWPLWHPSGWRCFPWCHPMSKTATSEKWPNLRKPHETADYREVPSWMLGGSSAQAEMGLKNFTECISDCKKVLQLDEENRDAKVLLRQAVAAQKEADKKSKAVFASILAKNPREWLLSGFGSKQFYIHGRKNGRNMSYLTQTFFS